MLGNARQSLKLIRIPKITSLGVGVATLPAMPGTAMLDSSITVITSFDVITSILLGAIFIHIIGPFFKINTQ